MTVDPEAAIEAPPAADGPAATPPADSIERGAYEILRDRLLEQGRTLQSKAQALNQERIALFGGQETAVIGNERIRTRNNCVPRDVVAVGDHLLFGYNVFMGLKSDTAVEDVFSLHRFVRGEEGQFQFDAVEAGSTHDFLAHESFIRDFQELYRYYKQTRLMQLRRLQGKILAVFQVGDRPEDVKVFRWAVDASNQVRYVDNRGERETLFPSAFDFEWTETTRADHVSGRHPHVSILDEVFVEAVGGDLTVKIENNTEDGQGIYREPVSDLNQSLHDAQMHYARLGTLILLRILPYRETQWRHLVYNTRTRAVVRLDAIGQSCVQLPEDHGIIFPGGYYLQSGQHRTFDTDTSGMRFVEKIASPNGEDVLFVFYHRDDGRWVLLPYNLIRKEVQAAIPCHGYGVFEDGRMVLFRATSEEPTRIHAMQIWQTPFTSDEFFAQPNTGSFLEKVGNVELVRGIADTLGICRRIDEQTPTQASYEDIIAAATHSVDAYLWLGRAELGDLAKTLRDIRGTAELVLDEFEKVQSMRAQAAEALRSARVDLGTLTRSLGEGLPSVTAHVDALTRLRKQQGHLITLRDLRYVDREALQALEAEVVGSVDEVGQRTIDFLLLPEALDPYQAELHSIEGALPGCQKTSEVEPLRGRVDGIGAGLEVVAELVAGLKLDDATVRTAILEGITELFAGLNRVRALVTGRRRELLSKEGVAEFGVQFQLYGQTVAQALSLVDTPEAADAQLGRLLLGLEQLESRFGEFDQFLEQLATKREEVMEALNGRKQQLLEERQRRAQNMAAAATRILEGIARRTFESQDVLNGFFAADPVVAKVRDLVTNLRRLGDAVKADEVESRLKASRDEAARILRDRVDIFEAGGSVIKLGRHRFSVNTQAFDLVLVPRDGGMALHLVGSDFFELVQDPQFEKTRDCWDQSLISETADVYRGEYLAACILAEAEQGSGDLTIGRLLGVPTGQGTPAPELLALVRDRAASRYEEGYERGLHDLDATLVLEKVLDLYRHAGLLRFAPRPRAMATLFAAAKEEEAECAGWERRATSLGRLRTSIGYHREIGVLAEEIAGRIGAFLERHHLSLHPEEIASAGLYVVEELARGGRAWVASQEASALRAGFLSWLEGGEGSGGRERAAVLQSDLKALDEGERYGLAFAWLETYVRKVGRDAGRHVLEEAVVLLLTEGRLEREIADTPLEAQVTDLLGQHPRITGRILALRLDEFLARLGTFRQERVPRFREFVRLRQALLDRERIRLRLSEYMPQVMSSFVRNKLINEIYLPMIGDNLAKQIGSVGETKRTDLMGLLLLVSPPGYGKTTLMEYVASRLGLVFMKINGPALGSGVTSLDPGEAPNATARQEVDKINLALEMGNNVMLYVDDIQHTNPEFLQKFISLCDAQRRIEGVWRGLVRTYDLRGKRFCVCMAGNPYTESGQKFQIPDMLANRADTYNLGEILQGRGDLFALSYIENAMTSNRVLAGLATREMEDVYKLVAMARGTQVATSELSHACSGVELQEIVEVLRKLFVVQELLLAVNRAYIASAAQDDAFRTEPPFKLQGSYRNMNKLAEKIVAVMNSDELQRLIDDHYTGEAQTLTTGAEHNLLKLAELRGRMSPQQAERWTEIRRGFQRRQMMGGREEDPVVRVTSVLTMLSQKLEDIDGSVTGAGRAATEAARAAMEEMALLAKQAAVTRAEAPAMDLGPYLEALNRTLGALSEARPAAGAPELGEALARMASVLETRTVAPSRVVWEAPAGTLATAMPSAGVPVAEPRKGGAVDESVLPLLKLLVDRMRGPDSRVIVMDQKVLDFLDRLETATTGSEVARALRSLESDGSGAAPGPSPG